MMGLKTLALHVLFKLALLRNEIPHSEHHVGIELLVAAESRSRSRKAAAAAAAGRGLVQGDSSKCWAQMKKIHDIVNCYR